MSREELSNACRSAAEALQVLSNVNPTGILNCVEANSSSFPTRLSNVFGGSTPSNKAHLEEELTSRFPTISYNRSRKRSSSSSSVSLRSKKKKAQRGRPGKDVVFKDLVFIPDPEETDVPTHKKRLELEEQNFVIHEFPFNRSWSALTLKEEIRKTLPNGSEFEYMKACYGTLVKPKLANGVEVTANVLLKLAGQGNIYVRSLINMSESDDENTNDVLLRPTFATTSSYSESAISTQLADERLHAMYDNREDAVASLTEDSDGWVGTEFTIKEIGYGRDDEAPDQIANLDDDAVNTRARESVPQVAPASLIPLGEPDLQVAVGRPVSPTVIDEPVPPIAIDEPYPPSAVDGNDPLIIKIHHTMIRQDLIEIFSDDSIMSKPLVGVIINAKGEEENGQGSGVTREIFTLFWSEFAESSLIGEEERVPFIRHDYNRETWQAVARILVKGFTDCSYFPLRLSKVFMCSVFYDEALVTVPMLLSSFKCYVSNHEAEILEHVLSKEMFLDSREFKDFLNNFDCRKVVRDDNVHDIVIQMARKELIQKPKYVSDCWSDIVSKLKLYFPTTEDLVAFYKSHEPTNVKVVNILHADITNNGEREAFNHLKKYIRGLEKSKLHAFLKFVTASDIIITDRIEVTFSSISGAARRPISHTCGCILELPSTYANFCELREEFSNVLSADSWKMNIA